LRSFDAWGVGGLRGAGQRSRSGAFAPDFPLVIVVVAFGDCLPIPSGLSTPRAPQAADTPGCVSGHRTSAGAIGLLRVLLTGGVSEEYLAGPAPCRPRRRPRGAYAVSGVGGMALRISRLITVPGRIHAVAPTRPINFHLSVNAAAAMAAANTIDIAIAVEAPWVSMTKAYATGAVAVSRKLGISSAPTKAP